MAVQGGGRRHRDRTAAGHHRGQRARSGTPNRSNSSASKAPREMSNSIVRDALDASVTSSPVDLKITQASMVPNIARPSRARPRRPSTFAQQPFDLRTREVGLEHEPGPLANQRLVAGVAQLVAAGRGAAVLPDDRACQRLAAGRVPDDNRLTLIGDPDGVELSLPHSRVVQRLSGHRLGDRPALGRVMLEPARPGGYAGQTRDLRGRQVRPRGRRPGRWCRSCPDRWPGSRARPGVDHSDHERHEAAVSRTRSNDTGTRR